MTTPFDVVVELKRLTPDLTEELGLFFEKIDGDPHFHPHPFTAAYAITVCSYRGTDLYIAAIRGTTILAYGMLRGWDNGYDIPTLGLVVDRNARGSGLGELLVRYMHYLARIRGASSVRLKVYPDNPPALSLYRKLGYVFREALEENQYVGYCSL